MAQSLDRLRESPSQTAGPYVHIGLTPNFCGIGGVYATDLGCDHGQRQDQRRAHRPAHPRARRHRHAAQGCADRDLAGGCGRALQFSRPNCAARPIRISWAGAAARPTWKPGSALRDDQAGPRAIPGWSPDGAAYHLWIVARGINLGLHTRLYFSDEEKANAEDPILARIEHRIRVPTLIAERQGDTYVFDVHLQGEKETVFFDS